jgi:uncharacterized protein involved in exopolysaccharide biosynthesis
MRFTFSTVKRIIRKNLLWLTLFPVLLAGVVWYMTRDMPLEFTSTATIYTGIASGYSITSGDNDRIDNTSVNNAFDNLITTIKSRETISEVGLRLLARHLTQSPQAPGRLNVSSANTLHQIADATLKRAVVIGNEQATLANLQRLMSHPDGNSVKAILYNSSTVYANESVLGRFTVTRKNTSDMLDLSCKGNDPIICQQTLVFLIDVFRHRYTQFKTSETTNVVGYFEQQRQQAFSNLKGAEDRLTKYSVNNKIINYPEQSKFAAASKEAIVADYYKEQMDLKAADASLREIDQKFNEHGSVLAANKDLNDKRADLAKIQTQLANATLYGYSKETIRKLQDVSIRLTAELKTQVHRYYNSTHSLEGIPQEDLTDEYVRHNLRSQESKARLGVMKKRLSEFNQVYDELAPLGSEVGRLQREISVAEREYLAVLHGLNLAQLRQKDLEMKGALSIIDPPSLPMKPQPTIRRILIMASFLAGLMLVLSVIFGQVLLSSAIASPERVEPLINIPLAAALPARRFELAGPDLDFAEHCMLEQLRSRIMLETQPVSNAHLQCLVPIFSTRPRQGKSWVGSRISDLFAESGHQVIYLYADKLLSQVTQPTLAHSLAYPVMTDFTDINRLAELLQSVSQLPATSYDYVFLELPALLDTALPVQLVSQSAMSLLVVNAKSSWSQSDQELCTLYKRASHGPVVAVLDEVEPDRLEVLMGPLPKRGKLESRHAKPGLMTLGKRY